MKKKPENIGVLGYGEVGKAIAQFYKKPKIKDLSRDDGLAGVEVLHVCIPWTKSFVSTVAKEVVSIQPKLIIIHSTVVPGTTAALAKKISLPVAYSPIRGVHPNLYKGIKTFIKYVGADDKKAGQLARKHLEGVGIKVKAIPSTRTVEAFKLWDTTQYGWMIVLNKEMAKWCKKNGVDFDMIYTDGNISYNEGYAKLGRKDVIRPTLSYREGKIGGHCVIPNAKLLDSEIAKILLKRNNTY